MKSRSSAIILLLSTALILATAIASLAKPYVSSKGYQITPAQGWVVDSSGAYGTDLLVHANPSDGFAPNLNVLAQPLPAGATLKTMRDMGNTQMRQMLTGYKQISQGYTSIDGLRALKTVATHTFGTPPRSLFMRQMVAIKGDTVYTFTCTALGSNHTKYDTAFSAMLKSIKWKK